MVEKHTFLSFTQTDICASSRQVAQTLIMTGVLVVVRHDRFILAFRCIPFPLILEASAKC